MTGPEPATTCSRSWNRKGNLFRIHPWRPSWNKATTQTCWYSKSC